MEEYSSQESTGSGDDKITETVKLALCRAVNCPRLSENKGIEGQLEEWPERKEYAGTKISLQRPMDDKSIS